MRSQHGFSCNELTFGRQDNYFFCNIFGLLSRKKQIDAQVEAALQLVNEKDVAGRSVPEELTVDDIGRLLLRRGSPEDITRIKKLLGRRGLVSFVSEESVDDSLNRERALPARLWSASLSSSTVVCSFVGPLLLMKTRPWDAPC